MTCFANVSSSSSSSSSRSRNEYYLGGIILLLQDHRTMSTKLVCSSQYMVTDQH